MIYLFINNNHIEKKLQKDLQEIAVANPGSISSNLICQLNYILGLNKYNDYHLQFNEEMGTLSVAKEVNCKKVLEYFPFIKQIFKYISEKTPVQTQNNSTMKKLTADNLSELTENDVVFVFKNKNYQNNALMLLTTSRLNGEMNYGFMNLENPLLSERVYVGEYMSESLEYAIKDNNDVYSVESISMVNFNKPEQVQNPIDSKPKIKNAASAIEKYIEKLLDDQIDFLLTELAITQFPKETIKKTAKRFFNEKMK